MADEYYSSTKMFKVPPNVLLRTKSLGSNPSGYNSPLVQHASLSAPIQYSADLANQYENEHTALLASYTMGSLLSPVSEDYYGYTEGMDMFGAMPELDLGAAMYHQDTIGLMGEATSVSANLEMRRQGHLAESCLSAEQIADIIERGSRAAFKHEVGSNSGYANVLLPDSVYDTDFNIGSAI